MNRAQTEKDRGAVLLTTLLIMALMSALAVAMMGDIRTAIKRAANIQAYGQADWYVKAAEDFAAQYIEDTFISLEPSQQNAALRSPQFANLPLDGGSMNLRIMDGTQCLPLSSLTGSPSESEQSGNLSGNQISEYSDIFRRLLVSASGLSEQEAQMMTAAIMDWQDSDQQMRTGGAEDYAYLALTPAYRTPNAPFLSVSELRAVRGMNEDILTAIAPYICAGDKNRTTGQININTLGAEHLLLLGAFLGEGQESLATQIIQSRPSDGYKTLPDDVVSAGISNPEFKAEYFHTKPEYLWVEVDIDFGTARRTILLEFKIDTNGVTRTYRHYGTEGRRPYQPVEPETGQESQR